MKKYYVTLTNEGKAYYENHKKIGFAIGYEEYVQELLANECEREYYQNKISKHIASVSNEACECDLVVVV